MPGKSHFTIISFGLLKKVRDRGVNLYNLVTTTDDGSDTQVYDASGNLMSFLMVIAATIQVEGGDTAKVQMHIQRSDHDIILIGINALESLGIRVQVGAKVTKVKVKRDSECAVEDNARRQPKRAKLIASAAHRVVIPPLALAEVGLAGPVTNTDHVFLSDDDRIKSAVCHTHKGSATVSVVNRGAEPCVIKKRQALGTWTHDQWYDPKTSDIPGDMLEIRRAQLPSMEEKMRMLIEILKQNQQSGEFPQQLEALLRK